MSTEQSRRPVVFIVDPDATVRELVADMLGDLGLEAVEFDRVPDAFRQLIRGEKDPDLLIVDHYLPGPFFRSRTGLDGRAALPHTSGCVDDGFWIRAKRA